MEILIAVAIAGTLLAVALARVLWMVISRAVDNLIAWAIYNFGNEKAVRRLKDKWR